MGTPLIDIVEKVLESKAKELLPKICQTVESLCEARAKQQSEAVISKEIVPISVHSVVGTPKSDYANLSLPIDLPGLNTPAKPSKTSGKQDNKPKVKKELPKAKPKPLSAGVNVSKPKTVNNKELKSVVEKEKPKVYRIPKKPKVDIVDAQNTVSLKEENCDPSKNQEKVSSIDDSKTSSKRRSARLASQTDSKASSDNEGSNEEAPPTRKRRRASKSKIVLSSDDSDFSSDSYQSDSSEEHSQNTSPGTKRSSKKKSKLSKEVRQSLSKSPILVITRYNRSVKPNRRYYNASAEVDEELTEVRGELELAHMWEESLPLTLDITRPRDDGCMEIQENSVLLGDERVNVVYEMINPKPKALKVKKNLLKGIRSRKKTKSRINFFQHR